MDIRFHEKLYRDGISDKKLVSLKRKIKRQSLKLNLFLVTLPIGNEGVLEVYWYPELLQIYYKKMQIELMVVGLAKDREGAFHLVEQIVSDVGFEEGNIPIKEYFKESR